MNIIRKRSLRLAEHLDVDIKNINGKHIHAQTLNISLGGFAIQCDTEVRNQLTPQGDIVKEGRPVEVEVDVNLQLHNQTGDKNIIHARCRVIYSRRIAQDKCQIGMCFIELLGDGQSRLSIFIQKYTKG